MKSKNLLVFLAIFLFVFAVGCKGGDKDDETTSTGNPYVGGTEGLKMTFVDGAPPEEIYDKGTMAEAYPFEVLVDVENVGESAVNQNDAYFKIEGISPTEFGIRSDALKKSLPVSILGQEKLSDGSRPGDIETIEFTGLKYSGKASSGGNEYTMRVVSCYNYQTKVDANICVRQKPLREEKNPLCTLDDPVTYYNSGAPVQISNIEERYRGTSRIQIDFDIEEVGDGLGVYDKADKDCDSQNFESTNMVFVDVDTSEIGLNPQCSRLGGGSSGYVRLLGDEPVTVSCTLDVSNLDVPYTSWMQIRLDYRYKDMIEKQITVLPS